MIKKIAVEVLFRADDRVSLILPDNLAPTEIDSIAQQVMMALKAETDGKEKSKND